MNFISARMRLLAAASSVFALVACNSVTDTKFKSSIPAPIKNYVLRGEVSGLTTKPVVLHYVGSTAANTKDLTIAENGAFTFSGVPVGSYTVTVATPPIGKLCSITNGSGSISADVTNMVVTCQADPNAPTYKVSGTVVGLAANATALGLKLTSDGGDETVSVAAGTASFAFTTELLTDFAYAVTVSTAPTTPGAFGGPANSNNCVINTVGSGTVVDHNIPDVQIVCGFTIGGTAVFNGPGTVGAGLQLTLADATTAAPVVANFAYDPAAPAFTFPGRQPSTAAAKYTVSVAQQPAGQVCVVRNAGSVSLVTAVNNTSVAVLCQGLPIVANQLTGTYKSLARDFLTFFADGTFLYGTHSATAGASGVEHGFYSYNCCGPTSLFLTVATDTNGASGFASMGVDPAFVFIATTTKSVGPPSALAFSVGATAYSFTAAASTAGQFQGAWTSADRLRAFAYNSTDGTVFAYGVNGGAGNVQDECLTLGAAAVSGNTGSYTPTLTPASCTIPGGLAPINVDPSGGAAAFPGTPGAFGALAVDYTVAAGTPNALSLQTIFGGAAFGPPLSFTRSQVN